MCVCMYPNSDVDNIPHSIMNYFFRNANVVGVLYMTIELLLLVIHSVVVVIDLKMSLMHIVT
jgi:hypothetical protein